MALATLITALLLAAAAIQQTAAVPPPATIYTDRDMGIQHYTFAFQHKAAGFKAGPNTTYELRVHLRAICTKGPDILIKGFAGALSLGTQLGQHEAQGGHAHLHPTALQKRTLEIINTVTNHSSQLSWVGPDWQGLRALVGKLQPEGKEVLRMEGCRDEHQLSLVCQGPSLPLARTRQTAFPEQGLWNVVTSASGSSIPPKTLAYLLLLHMSYHERLGMHGTILRCNLGEAQELAILPNIMSAVAAKKLIIWPWVHEHSVSVSPYYWQKPRHQLTLLASFGHDVKLAFFDLDEYLVLLHGGTLQNSTCLGKPLLQQQHAGWRFARYAARSCNQSVDLDCWLAGKAMPVTDGVDLLVERCPCRDYGFPKLMVQPHLLQTIGVHYMWPQPGAPQINVPHGCGFLLHLHALLHNRKDYMPKETSKGHLKKVVWQLAESGSAQVRLPSGTQGTWMDDETCNLHDAFIKAGGKHLDRC